jgi:heme exporter protein C
MHKYANPLVFNNLADKVLPWLITFMVLSLGLGFYYGFLMSPEDYQQGEMVRLMYLHVPSAWMCMGAYMVVAIASAVSIIWRHPLADITAKAAAPIGMMFTVLALITGSLWGKPMWGAWWVWDARLTSVLVLFFLYLGYMAIWSAFEDQAKAARAAAILALVGVINIPIIKFSVDWWNTLHQPASILRLDGPTIDESMLWRLLAMIVAFKLYFAVVLLWRMKAEMMDRKVRALSFNMAAGK